MPLTDGKLGGARHRAIDEDALTRAWNLFGDTFPKGVPDGKGAYRHPGFIRMEGMIAAALGREKRGGGPVPDALYSDCHGLIVIEIGRLDVGKWPDLDWIHIAFSGSITASFPMDSDVISSVFIFCLRMAMAELDSKPQPQLADFLDGRKIIAEEARLEIEWSPSELRSPTSFTSPFSTEEVPAWARVTTVPTATTSYGTWAET